MSWWRCGSEDIVAFLNTLFRNPEAGQLSDCATSPPSPGSRKRCLRSVKVANVVVIRSMGEISITEDMEGGTEPLSGPEVQCEVSVAQPVMIEDGVTLGRLSPECSEAVPSDSTLAPPRDLKRSCSVTLSSSLPSKSPTEWPRGGVLMPRRRVKSSCDTNPLSNLLLSPNPVPHPEHSGPVFSHRVHNPRLGDILAPPLSQVPQDLSRKRPAPDYPIELQVHLRQQVGMEGAGGRMEWVEMRCREGKRPNRAGERVKMKDGGEGRSKGGKAVDKIKEEPVEEYATPSHPSDKTSHLTPNTPSSTGWGRDPANIAALEHRHQRARRRTQVLRGPLGKCQTELSDMVSQVPDVTLRERSQQALGNDVMGQDSACRRCDVAGKLTKKYPSCPSCQPCS
ncbi:hypothetical protein O3P69_015436 [Scylla paramamosain]|uniref:Uncharacterized protein n=1 Tax=Scylla paramamosain TaxID=85552 RepID=A0AAW0T5S2_SCYPA